MDQLRTFAERLIADNAPAAEVDTICRALFDLFAGTSQDAAAAAGEETPSTQLESGLALSPALAARCLLDSRRTRAFVRGTRDAIRTALDRFPASTVEVVYAGCGPFAPLALLVIPFLESDRISLTLLDVNEASLRSVETLIEVVAPPHLAVSVVCADASRYRHPSPVHVLVSETMQRSLVDEPFVEIMRNFRSQLATGALVVPERVTISLALVDAEQEQAFWNGGLAAPLEERAVVYDMGAGAEGAVVPRVKLTHDASRVQWVALVTRIHVQGSERLEPRESGLTMPEIIWKLSPLQRDVVVECRYVTGTRPHLEVEELTSN